MRFLPLKSADQPGAIRAAILTALALTFAPATAAQAACLAEGMSCQTTKGKLLEVCAGTEMFVYAYGDEEPAELELDMPFETAEVRPWSGMGFDIWSSAVFRNGEYSYEVWLSAPRDAQSDDDITGGVNIARNGKDIASLSCKPGWVSGSPAFFGEVMEDRGYCYDSESESWSQSCG